MNFLLHCWLGRSDPGLKAGGFLGDFIKGRVPGELPNSLARGIRLHRHIDIVSNQLPEMKSTYHRFGPALRRPAPVLLDLVADHILAKRWDEYGGDSLSEFTRTCYRDIAMFEIPQSAMDLYQHMSRTDLLARYADEKVIAGVIKRVLKRLKYDRHVNDIDAILGECMNGFEEDFKIYYSILESEAAAFLTAESESGLPNAIG